MYQDVCYFQFLDSEAQQREEAAIDQNDALEEQLSRLQATVASLKEELDSFRASGDGLDSRKFQDLENKYKQAKSERMELLRTQSVNSQKLLELNERIKSHEFIKEKLEAEY
jgi:chromosome segregation ATPase